MAKANGLRACLNWNISALLSRTKGKSILVAEGWELTAEGKAYVSSLVGPLATAPVISIASALRVHVPKITNVAVRGFVEESIECFERRLFRSAVVLSWVGAVAILYDHVISHHLADFNKEALRRDAKWKAAKTSDDLAKMGEYDFLQVAEAISVIGKNVKHELEKQLKLRNGCGHPNSLVVGENMVSAHLEVLILNIYSKFL